MRWMGAPPGVSRIVCPIELGSYVSPISAGSTVIRDSPAAPATQRLNSPSNASACASQQAKLLDLRKRKNFTIRLMAQTSEAVVCFPQSTALH